MPLSLSQYIQSTYFSQDEDNASDCDLIQIHVPKKRIRSVSAAGQAIDSLGHVSADLQKHFNAIVILDLSDTGIEDCSLVRQILSHFPNLQEFITSKNPQLKFNRVATASSHDPAALPDITTVISSDCSYNWSDVISFAQNLWPSSIKSLTLHANKITNISMPDETCFLQQLTHLDLSCNPLKDWNEVCNLTQLPRLRNLNLSHCAIDSIKFTSNSPQFPHLVTLNVRENNLSSWLDVVQLQKLPSLKELNFKGNPLLSSFEDLTACHLILVRLPKLTKVNNADITRETLKEAEKYYVNTFYTEYESANEEWFRLHPTYKDILEQIGAPLQKAKKGLSYITITLESSLNGTRLQKKIPASTKIGDLKVMVKRLFRLPQQSEIDLTWKTAQNESFEYPLDEERSQIGSYELGKDDRITFQPSI